MNILGIDPGTRFLGWGILNQLEGVNRYSQSGRLVPKGDDKCQKLQDIFSTIRKIIKDQQIDVVAIERTFYSKNIQTTLRLGEVIAAVILAAMEEGITVEEYPPKLVKQSVTGNGNASKSQVAFMVSKILNVKSIKSADEYDALAVSLCWTQRSRRDRLILKS
ncbi:crossover junction endodeoxyribonuclease RuvC [bacterium]|nr:crossover junction endodeoxyribonuclease RuvC [bacterium]